MHTPIWVPRSDFAAPFELDYVALADVETVVEKYRTSPATREALACAVRFNSEHELVRHLDPTADGHPSRSMYKLRELFAGIPDLQPNGTDRTLHVCEAPGGFVDAVMALPETAGVSWHAVSLVDRAAPTFPARIASVKKPNGHARVVVGSAGNGDILDAVTAACTIHECGAGQVRLVTADADDDNDPRVQWAELALAFRALLPGGGLVLRLLTHPPTSAEAIDRVTRVVAVCKSAFDRVALIRPQACPAGSCELYAVGIGFALGTVPDGDTLLERVQAAAYDNVPLQTPDNLELVRPACHAAVTAVARQYREKMSAALKAVPYLVEVGITSRERSHDYFVQHYITNPQRIEVAETYLRRIGSNIS
jgi:hypothetical protein